MLRSGIPVIMPTSGSDSQDEDPNVEYCTSDDGGDSENEYDHEVIVISSDDEMDDHRLEELFGASDSENEHDHDVIVISSDEETDDEEDFVVVPPGAGEDTDDE